MVNSRKLDRHVMMSSHDSIDSVIDQALDAENRGFSLFSIGETTGWNSIPILAIIAEKTNSIDIANNVLPIFSRSPTLLAQTSLTMHEVSNGRFRLGLGASSPAITEDWHGQRFDRPLRYLRETIEVIRELYEGGDANYLGEMVEIGGLKYIKSVPQQAPLVDISSLGPKAVELTGRFGDGWVPSMFTPDGLRNRLDDLDRGAKLGGRSIEDVRVSPMIQCFAHEDGDYARSLVRRSLAFSIGAYGPFYGDAVARQGYQDQVKEMRAAWKNRDVDGMEEALSDHLLDSLAAVGTPNEVRDHVNRILSIDGIDAVRVRFVRGMSQTDKRRTLDTLAAPSKD